MTSNQILPGPVFDYRGIDRRRKHKYLSKKRRINQRKHRDKSSYEKSQPHKLKRHQAIQQKWLDSIVR